MKSCRSRRGDREGMDSGSEEYRYDNEPSTRPVVERVYEVARFGDGNDEMCKRKPSGVGKSRSAIFRHYQSKEEHIEA
jgi:hypothetical protein